MIGRPSSIASGGVPIASAAASSPRVAAGLAQWEAYASTTRPLSTHQLKTAFTVATGARPSKAHLRKLGGEAHAAAAAATDKAAFVAAVERQLEAEAHDELRVLFNAFDVHHRGFLTMDDVKEVFMQVCPHVQPRQVEDAFNEADTARCGRLSFRAFELLMAGD